MKIACIALMLLFLPSLALAETIGVAKTNFSISASYAKSPSNSPNTSDAVTASFSGAATTAIGRYGGITGYYGESTLDFDLLSSTSTSSIKDKSKEYAVTLFLRDASKGRIGIAYSKKNSLVESTDPYLVFRYPTINYTTYTLLLDYYFNNVTLAWYQANSMVLGADVVETNSTTLSGLWHANENLSLRFSTFTSEAKYNRKVNNTKSVSIRYQPEVFNRTTDIVFRYSVYRTEYEYDNENTSYSISINYYFDTSVSLKNRERKYYHTQ